MNPLKKLVNEYQMSDTSRAVLAQSPIVMMVSITGGGKNTIIEQLLKTNSYHYVISHTTRTPRENNGQLEENGVNYWFVTEEQMSEKLKNGDFIEAKWVHDAYVYGTSVDELVKAQESGKTPLLEIDVQGVGEIVAVKPDAKVIFIVPPSYEIWMERLSRRGDQSEDEQQRRLSTAKKELEFALSQNYFEYLVNDNLEDSVNRAEIIIEGQSSSPKGKDIAQQLLERLG